ncbi:MAG: hypothetical protein Q7J54_01770 [Candidatus Woesearchaeota archaeon]|nr:hypothetical protein [Candidatus Woesearchaeota archaeon]
MIKGLVALVKEREEVPKYKPLFGKYHVSVVNDYPDSRALYVGDQNSPLAILNVSKDKNPRLHASFASNSPTADLDAFKQLYEDAKEHFSRAGVRINTPRTHKVFPGLKDYTDEELPDFGQNFGQLRKLEITKLPAVFLTTSTLMGYQKEPKLTTGEIAKQVYESVDAYLLSRFPDQEEEIVPYGSFGSISKGSKIWTLKSGLYVTFEAPMFDDSPWAIDMQVNSDETHSLEEVLDLGKDIREHILSKFEVEFFDYEANHSFAIDLGDLNKRRLQSAVESPPRISDQ